MEKNYDFYIICHEVDSQYAEKILEYLESLENGKFKGFYGERDDMPGRTVVHNLEYAIEHSEKIILILSKQSITDKWTEYQRHVGLAYILDSNHGKNNVLPIYVGDIKEKDMPLSLNVFNGIYYCADPKSNFWMKLKRSLAQD